MEKKTKPDKKTRAERWTSTQRASATAPAAIRPAREKELPRVAAAPPESPWSGVVPLPPGGGGGLAPPPGALPPGAGGLPLVAGLRVGWNHFVSILWHKFSKV